MNSSQTTSTYKLYFSLQAKEDIDGILQYTLETWGIAQMEKYSHFLDGGFQTILRNPAIGREREIYFPGCRQLHIKRHMIFYKINDNDIGIVRVLRDDMDFAKWL